MSKKTGVTGPVHYYAKVLSLSREGMRFLEEKGFIHPAKDTANGYRSYGFGDSVTIVNYKKLRAFGFSVEQVYDFLTAEDSQAQRTRLEAQAETLEEEIRCREKVLGSLRRRMQRLYEAQEIGSRYVIRRRPALFWMESRRDAVTKDNSLAVDTMTKWNRNLSAYAESCVVWTLEKLLDGEGHIYAGQVIDADLAAGEDLGDVRYSSAVPCLTAVREFPYDDRMQETLFLDMLAYMKAQSLVPAGDGIARLLRMTIDGQRRYHFTWELMIPVSE